MSIQTHGVPAPVVFNFDTKEIRTFKQNDLAWFAAADVCAVLHIKNHRDSLQHLDDDEKGVVSTDTLGGQQKISVVSESGLYALVLRSRKPEARKFAKWVTSEVLPAIRKTGSYQTTQPGDIEDKSYYRACRDELFKFMDSLPAGTKWVQDEQARQRIADGFLTDILCSRRWLVSFGDGGVQMKPVDKNVCLIDPASPSNLHTLIDEFIPLTLLPKIIDPANCRIAKNLNRLVNH